VGAGRKPELQWSYAMAQAITDTGLVPAPVSRNKNPLQGFSFRKGESPARRERGLAIKPDMVVYRAYGDPLTYSPYPAKLPVPRLEAGDEKAPDPVWKPHSSLHNIVL
jgi:hypothetical protein